MSDLTGVLSFLVDLLVFLLFATMVASVLTPPDVIELDPEVWLRLACGITTWAEEKDAGHISAVGERDDLSDLLPL